MTKYVSKLHCLLDSALLSVIILYIMLQHTLSIMVEWHQNFVAMYCFGLNVFLCPSISIYILALVSTSIYLISREVQSYNHATCLFDLVLLKQSSQYVPMFQLITVSVSGRPSGTYVSQTNYTLSNLSSAIVI